jgi:outer membrane protein insertion porin family
MFLKIFKIIFFIILSSRCVLAENILNIEVEGNKRLSKETIIVLGDITLNKDYSDQDLNTILKNLYTSDFFNNVELKVINNLLKIIVVENSIIEDIEINGVKNKPFHEFLRDSLKLKVRNSFTKITHQNDINLIKNVIKQSGYYFAEVKTSLITNEIQNSVRLIYDINLGKKAKIDNISFIGDKKIKDGKLINVIVSEEARFWKFLSNKIYLDRSRIDLDQRLLKNYYKNKGYYNVKINNSYVELKDNGLFKLIFNIESGKRYIFNNIKLEIPSDFNPKHFIDINDLLKKLENENYSLNKINKIIKEIDKIALTKNYEFISAELDEEVVDGNKLNIKISFKETKKYYVEKINIFGNQFTLEEVIRNSFIVDEGDPYNELIFNKSINNIKSKGIFKNVIAEINDGSNSNYKIIDITVEEKPTGEISLGAGIGTSGGTVAFGVKENNFLGKGISLDTNISISENTIKGKFVYAKPNFNYTDNTLFTSLSSTSTDSLIESGFKTSKVAFSLGTRFEQYENIYFNPEIASEFETLKTTSTASSALKKQSGDYFDLYFNYSLDNDLRNQRYQTSDGYRNFFSQELPIVSKNSEIVNSFQSSIYHEIIPDMIGRLTFYGSAVNSLSDKDVRISKRLYLPQSKLRGFESGKVGPIDNNDYVGGNYLSAINLSSTIPGILPSLQNLDVSMFFDAANIWGVDYDGSINDSNKIRSSTGLAMDFTTPIGPLNFSLSAPLTKASTDKTETFRFNLGTTF